MRLKRNIIVTIVLVLSSITTTWVLFGCRDIASTETFEIVESQSGSPNQIAILARRYDHAALSGDTYFVVIGTHLYDSAELRDALYHSHAIFVADRNGMTLRWSGPKELTIQCQQCGITKNRIESQKFSEGGIAIQYVGFP